MNAYDEIAYPGYPFRQSHPDRMAVVASLLGMQPAPAPHCRVLELGCGDGGNLIPMAHSLPDSEFTGIDLAESPIARGQALADELALRNIRLLARGANREGALRSVGRRVGACPVCRRLAPPLPVVRPDDRQDRRNGQ